MSDTSASRRAIPILLDNAIWVILAGTAVLFVLLAPDKFATPENGLNILVHSSVLGIMVIGQGLVLLTGNFDLSAESTLGLTAVVGAWLMVGQAEGGGGVLLDPLLVIMLMLLMGALIGLWNGFLITRMRMNNFIVTLAMLIVLRGAALIITSGITIYGFPDAFTFLGGSTIGPVPVSVIVVIAAFALAWVFTTRRRFGRVLYAVGGNRDAALASGIEPNRAVWKVYVISGVMAASAGWMLAGRLDSVTPSLGSGMIFEVFAAAVIGGISLNGGRGRIVNAFGGVLLLSCIDSGLNLVAVSPYWIDAIRGLVILFAMFIDAQKSRYRLFPAEESEDPSQLVPVETT